MDQEFNRNGFEDLSSRPENTESGAARETGSFTPPSQATPNTEATFASTPFEQPAAPGEQSFDPTQNGFYRPAARRKPGIQFGTVVKKGVSLILVAAVGFAGGLAGARFGGAGGAAQKIIYKTVTSEDIPSASENTAYTGNVLSNSEVAALVSPASVIITTEALVSSNTWFGGQYIQSGAGSGVVISEDGTILTCAHVINGATSIRVTLADGSEYDATVVGADVPGDIAVIKIEAEGLTPVVLGDSDTLTLGDSVLAVGNPLGTLGGSITGGLVSALNREITINKSTMSVIQTDASVSPGNSGGGLFNQKGELIGIVNAKSTGDYTEGLGFAIPVNTAMDIAEDLMSVGHVTGRPALGVTVVNISDANSAMRYGVSSYGVYIVTVNEGGAAEAAGIQPGDMIISVDDTAIGSTEELTGLLTEYKVGDTVTVQLNRNRKLVTLEVTLGESQG